MVRTFAYFSSWTGAKQLLSLFDHKKIIKNSTELTHKCFDVIENMPRTALTYFYTCCCCCWYTWFGGTKSQSHIHFFSYFIFHSTLTVYSSYFWCQSFFFLLFFSLFIMKVGCLNIYISSLFFYCCCIENYAIDINVRCSKGIKSTFNYNGAAGKNSEGKS